MWKPLQPTMDMLNLCSLLSDAIAETRSWNASLAKPSIATTMAIALTTRMCCYMCWEDSDDDARNMTRMESTRRKTMTMKIRAITTTTV